MTLEPTNHTGEGALKSTGDISYDVVRKGREILNNPELEEVITINPEANELIVAMNKMASHIYSLEDQIAQARKEGWDQRDAELKEKSLIGLTQEQLEIAAIHSNLDQNTTMFEAGRKEERERIVEVVESAKVNLKIRNNVSCGTCAYRQEGEEYKQCPDCGGSRVYDIRNFEKEHFDFEHMDGYNKALDDLLNKLTNKEIEG